MNSGVYVIGPDVGPQKIGVSATPERRLSDLQVGSPFRLKVHHFIETTLADARRVEALAHAALRSHHQRGEWFNLTPAEAVAAVTEAKETAAMGATPARQTRLKRKPDRRTADGLVALSRSGAIGFDELEAGLAYRALHAAAAKAQRVDGWGEVDRIAVAGRKLHELEGDVVRAAGVHGLGVLRAVAYRAEVAKRPDLPALKAALLVLSGELRQVVAD